MENRKNEGRRRKPTEMYRESAEKHARIGELPDASEKGSRNDRVSRAEAQQVKQKNAKRKRQTTSSEVVSSAEKHMIRQPKVTPIAWIRSHWFLDGELPENEYYLRIASRYRVMKYIAIVLSLLLILGMMAVYSDDITVENLRYLLRDLDSSSSKYTGIYSTIRYDSGNDLEFALYKGDLVVVRSGQTSIYAMDGRSVMNEKNDFYSPVLRSSDQYFLVWDPGQTSNTLSVYNAFSLLHTKKFSASLYDAEISDSGIYAIATDATGYRGVVEVYDRDFELLTTVYKDKYIWDIALNADASRLLILSAYDQNGTWCTEVQLLDLERSETLMQFQLNDVLAYTCHFTEGGNYCILTEKDIRFYTETSELGKTVSFGTQIPIGWCFGDSYQAVIFNKTILGQEKTVRVYRDGAEVGVYAFEGQMIQSIFDDTTLYVLTENRLIGINCANGAVSEMQLESGCMALLPMDATHLMLCFSEQARTIDPSTELKSVPSDNGTRTGG